jgi:hypothetical protein
MDLSAGTANRVRATGDFGLSPAVILVTALVGCGIPVMMGWNTVAEQGLLAQTDAYQRVSRLVASFEAGRLLAHIPRDNAGTVLPLHWTHLLDAVIVVLALPLMPVMSTAKALHYAGAAIGPLSLVAAGLAVVVAVRSVVGPMHRAVVVAVLAMIGPVVLGYSAFGQADHHVLLGALAVLAAGLALRSGESERPVRCAALAGVTGGLGIWVSPELLPFVLFAWAVAILVDVEHEQKIGRRGEGFALGLLACLALALIVDPPTPRWLAAEADRLSRPFVELAVLMSLAAALGRRFAPALPGRWAPALLAGAIAAAAFLPWVWVYPAVLGGPAGVFSPEVQKRVWNHISEMRSLIQPRAILGYALVPTLVLVAGCCLLLWRGLRPLSVLAAVMAAVVVYFAWKHLRFCVYLHIAAAVAVGVMLERAIAVARSGRRRVLVILAAMQFSLLPLIGVVALPDPDAKDPTAACSIPSAAPGLESEAGKVVLTQLNYAPALIYFTRAIAVTGPYHRAEPRIMAVLDTYSAKTFREAKPLSFDATGAQAIMVCKTDTLVAGSFGAALATGTAPSWLVERPLPAESNFRLFDVR